jgi:hypothetical protein
MTGKSVIRSREKNGEKLLQISTKYRNVLAHILTEKQTLKRNFSVIICTG